MKKIAMFENDDKRQKEHHNCDNPEECSHRHHSSNPQNQNSELECSSLPLRPAETSITVNDISTSRAELDLSSSMSRSNIKTPRDLRELPKYYVNMATVDVFLQNFGIEENFSFPVFLKTQHCPDGTREILLIIKEESPINTLIMGLLKKEADRMLNDILDYSKIYKSQSRSLSRYPKYPVLSRYRVGSILSNF